MMNIVFPGRVIPIVSEILFKRPGVYITISDPTQIVPSTHYFLIFGMNAARTGWFMVPLTSKYNRHRTELASELKSGPAGSRWLFEPTYCYNEKLCFAPTDAILYAKREPNNPETIARGWALQAPEKLVEVYNELEAQRRIRGQEFYFLKR